MHTKKVIELIKEKRNLFITGPGGCGKTFLLKKIYMKLSAEGIIIALTGTTGVAAINLCEGVSVTANTFHSWAGIQLGEDTVEVLVKKIKGYKTFYNRYIKTNILIVDEISMFGAKLLDKMNAVFKAVRNSSAPFGGLQVIFSGDFLQLPPVKEQFAFTSETWRELNIHTIFQDKCKRFTNTEYWELLRRVRSGCHLPKDITFLKQRCEAYLSLKQREHLDNGEIIKPSILFSRKADVNYRNLIELNKLTTPSHTFLAEDSLENLSNKPLKRDITYYQKIVNDAVDEKITLKIGAQVMLKRNINVQEGLVNGSRGVVIDIYYDNVLSEYCVQVKFLNGTDWTIKLETWTISNKKFKFTRVQIPLILAWCITIHKIQGCTLDYCVCDLGKNIFCSGQAYVVLSRVRNPESLFISELSEKSFMVDKLALEFLDQERKKSIINKYSRPEFFQV